MGSHVAEWPWQFEIVSYALLNDGQPRKASLGDFIVVPTSQSSLKPRWYSLLHACVRGYKPI